MEQVSGAWRRPHPPQLSNRDLIFCPTGGRGSQPAWAGPGLGPGPGPGPGLGPGLGLGPGRPGLGLGLGPGPGPGHSGLGGCC